jgi:PAS domain S-box-containing protein
MDISPGRSTRDGDRFLGPELGQSGDVERRWNIGPSGRSVLRRERADASRRLAAVLDTCDELIWECGADATLSFVSGNVVRYLGYDANELVGRPLLHLLHPHDRIAWSRILAAANAGDIQEVRGQQMRAVAKDGTERWLDTNVVTVRRGRREAVVTGASRLSAHGLARVRAADEIRERVLPLLTRGNLDIVFQPIVSLYSGQVIGAEALARFPGVPPRRPDQWFTDAATVGLGQQLELLAVRAALTRARTAVPAGVDLWINVSPATIGNDELRRLLRTGADDSRRLVLEITEHASVEDYPAFLRKRDELAAMGVRFAVDDAGAGYASFAHILRLQPDFIKLDRDVVHGLDHDAAKRALTAAIVMFAMEVRCAVIAEGIETKEEFDAAALVGIDAAQGFFLSAPAPHHLDWATSSRAVGIPAPARASSISLP